MIILGRDYSDVIYRIYNINRSKTNHPIIVARTYLECKNSQLIEKEPFILEMTYCDGKKEIFTFDIFNEIVYSLNDKEEKIEKTKFGENKWFEIRKD